VSGQTASTARAWTSSARRDESQPPRVGRAFPLDIDLIRNESVPVDWGGQPYIKLKVVLSGRGVKVEPDRAIVTLYHDRDLGPVRFMVTPQRPGPTTLFCHLIAGTGLQLIGSFTIPLHVEPGA
jgi:hypothetical protein